MLEIRNVSINFPRFSLREVNLKAGPGEYFILFGPTGAGKTLIMEIITGLRRPESGRVIIKGRDVTSLDPAYRGIGYVPQDYALIPFKTVRQNIAFGLRSRPFRASKSTAPSRETGKRVDEMLSLLKIEHLADRMPAHLSGGEKQRTALGRALVVQPDVMLLDEPLSAVDENTGEALMKEMKALHERLRITTVHICHRLEEVFFMGEKMAVVRGGGIVQEGAPREVYNRPADAFVAGLMRRKNVIRGVVRREKGVKKFFLAGVPVCETAAADGDAFALIPEEKLSFYDTPPGFNHDGSLLFDFFVAEKRVWKPSPEILLEGSFSLRVEEQFLPGNISAGEKVYARIPAESVLVIEGPD